MPDEVLIKADNLSRSYGPHLAVDNVSFEVHRGEVLGFLGPNGAGKTTTLQMLTGNLAPSLGRVTIDGADILDQPLRAKSAIGYLPERPPLYRELTVDEYLRYAAQLHRLPRRSIRAAIDHAKDRCGLTEVGGRLIGNLSKGYRQRVGIAQAVIHNPPAVILDEPTVGLDPLQIREIRALIRELSGDHSVIISTHILPEVQATCDRVQIIHHGSLVLTDTIAGLSRQMESTCLIVGLRRPPPIDALESIAGVDKVQTLDDGHLRVGFGHQSSPAEAIARQAVEQDWGLYELSPDTMSLEQIFVDITRSEPQHDAAGDDPGNTPGNPGPEPDEETTP